jgi:small subunit ribosomal protein S7
MSRRRVAAKRDVIPDPKFGSDMLTKFMNMIMVSGKKSVAETIVYGALDIVRERLNKDPLEAFGEALDNIAPMVEVKSRRVGGATYQVPVEVKPRRASTLAIRWIVDYSRDRREKTMAECLANELMDAANGLGASMKKRDDMQKMAESNKAFAHYRW